MQSLVVIGRLVWTPTVNLVVKSFMTLRSVCDLEEVTTRMALQAHAKFGGDRLTHLDANCL